MCAVSASEVKRKGWKRGAIVFCIGVPIVSAVLLITQTDLPAQIQDFSDRWFHPLEKPYRYPYDQSLSGDRNPMAILERAIGVYQERVRQNPSSGMDQAALASAYMSMARTTGQGNWYLLADEAAQQSIAKLPFNNAEAMSILARVAEARHDFPEALRLADQVDKLDDALALRVTSNLAIGNLKTANQNASQLVNAALSMNAFMLQALVQTAQGKDADALKSFQQALAIEEAGDLSNSARIRTLLGRFYYEHGQLKQAEGLYREALHILPDYPLALLNLAQLNIRQGHYAAAERDYRQLTQAAQGSPTVYDPLVLRGEARLKQLQGDVAGANDRWNQAETLLRQSFIGTGTGSFGHRRDLARLLLERGRSPDVPEALSLMQTEVKIRRDASTLDTYAWALTQAGQLREAQRVIQEAIVLGTHEAGLFDRAGRIEQALGNTTQAVNYFQRALEVDPQFDDRARQALGLASGLGA